MFGSADVEVDREPVFFEFGVDEVLGVFVVGEADVVPAGAGPLGHGVGFADEFDAVGVGLVEPFLGSPGERWVGSSLGFEVVHVGRDDGEFIEGDGADEAGGVAVGVEFVPEWERFAPVALSGEEPVAEAVVDGLFAESGFGEPGGDFCFDFCGGEAGELAGVDGDAFAGEANRIRIIRRLDNRRHRKMERLRELKVARVVSRDRHDRTGSVRRKNVIRYPDRNRLSVNRIDRIRPREDAGLCFGKVGAVEVALEGGLFTVGFDLWLLLNRRQLINQKVLRRDNHIRRPKERIRTGRVNPKLILIRILGKPGFQTGSFELFKIREILLAGGRSRFATLPFGDDREVDFGSDAAADPVSLEGFDGFGPVEGFEFGEEAFGVGGDAEHPLPEWATLDGEVATFAAAVGGYFFVGEDGAEFGAPVDGGERLVGEAELILILPDGFISLDFDAFGDGEFCDGASFADALLAVGAGPGEFGVVPGVEEFEEDPLGPAEVVGVGGGEFAVPVVGEAEGFELAFEGRYVFGGGDARVGAGVDGVLLGGESEGVPTHGVEDVFALHAGVAAGDVGGSVTFGVADMEAGAGGVGEHVEDVKFAGGIGFGFVGGGEGLFFVPVGLPFGFDRFWVVAWHCSCLTMAW